MPQVILRRSVDGLPAGTLLECDRIWNLDLAEWLLVSRSGRSSHVRPVDVLSYADLFRRQPVSGFWFVGKLDRYGRTLWLECPISWELGGRPFRFESEGELNYALAGLKRRIGRNTDWIIGRTDCKTL